MLSLCSAQDFAAVSASLWMIVWHVWLLLFSCMFALPVPDWFWRGSPWRKYVVWSSQVLSTSSIIQKLPDEWKSNHSSPKQNSLNYTPAAMNCKWRTNRPWRGTEDTGDLYFILRKKEKGNNISMLLQGKRCATTTRRLYTHPVHYSYITSQYLSMTMSETACGLSYLLLHGNANNFL